MTTPEWISISAIIASGISAMGVGKLLDHWKEKRNNKMAIFKVLYGERGNTPISREFTIALNQIDIVFHGDAKVRAAWKLYADSSFQSHPDFHKKVDFLILLLQEMAKVLDYSLNHVEVSNYFRYQSTANDEEFSKMYYTEFYRVLHNSENFGTPRQDDSKK